MSAGLAGISAIEGFPRARPGFWRTIDTFLSFNQGRLYSLRAGRAVEVAAVLAQHFNDLGQRCWRSLSGIEGDSPPPMVEGHDSDWFIHLTICSNKSIVAASAA